ncbi:MAG: hypothetical protein IPH32_18740 [Bacteroidetes bacterium]|nr:hypothetical protein [Bacteroidota bacterium]
MFTEKNIFEAIAHNDKDENGIRRYKQTLPRKPNSVEKIKQEGILIEKYYDSEGYLSRENIVNNDKVREIKKHILLMDYFNMNISL